MALTTTPTVSQPAGRRLTDPVDTVNLLAQLEGLAVYGPLTANSAGTQAAATPLRYGLNQVGTVGGANYGVVLPAAQPGCIVAVSNAGGASMQIFGQGTDTLRATAGSTGVALVNAHDMILFCVVAGRWNYVTS